MQITPSSPQKTLETSDHALRRWKALVRVTISLALVALVIQSGDWQKVFERLASAKPAILAAALGAILVMSLLSAWRWIYVIRASGNRLDFMSAVQLVMIGSFFSQVLPSSIGGDAVRMWRLHRIGFSIQAAAVTTVIDRLVGLGGVLAMILIGLPWLLDIVDSTPARTGLTALVISGIAGLLLLPVMSRGKAYLGSSRLGRTIVSLGECAQSLRLSAYGGRALAISMLIQLGYCLVVYGVALSIDVGIALKDCILLVPLVILVSMVPVSIAGWGVREGVMIGAFGLVGISANDALAVSLLYGLVVLVASTPGGLLWTALREAQAGPSSRQVGLGAGD